MRSLAYVALVVCLLVPPEMVVADDADTLLKKRATSVYQEILSPFCPGRSLNDCPSSKAHELKDDILAQLKSGTPEAVVLDGVFTKFGDQYRAIPKSEGFGRMVWIAPLAFLVLGFSLAVFVVRRRKGGVSIVSAAETATGRSAGKALSPEAQAEVERELAKLDGRS